MFVKPAKPELIVRDPATVGYLPIPPEGKEVPEDSYWTRLILAGDVVRVEPVAAAQPSTVAQPARKRTDPSQA